MALTISKLKMWKDPGYTRHCVEVPPAGSLKLPAADFTSAADDSYRPMKASTLTALELPLSYCQVFEMSYLYIEASDSVGSVKLFGWIDSVDRIATSAEAVRINWTVDWWRSFSGDASFGSGIVRKCSDSSYKRPYKIQPRYWTISESEIYPTVKPSNYDQTRWKCTIVITAVVTTNQTSEIRQFFCPEDDAFYLSDDPNNVKVGMSMYYAYRGYIDEALSTMGYDAEIISVYVVPFRSGTPNNQDQYEYNYNLYQFTPTAALTIDGMSKNITFLTPIKNGTMRMTSTYTISNDGVMSDDECTYCVVDFDGNKLSELPYGILFKNVYAETDIGTSGGYLILNFINAATSYASYTKRLMDLNAIVGFRVTVPLPSIPITSNYWSSYIISGQRDYDVRSAEIGRHSKAVSGFLGADQQAISGAVGGALAGGGVAAAGGAVVGYLTSIRSTAWGLFADYYFDDKLQEAKDKLYSNQTNTLQLTGDSIRWWDRVYENLDNAYKGCRGPYLVKVNKDSVSVTEMNNDISLNGYDTEIPVSDVTSFITAGGPLRIEQLVIGGQIPPQSKQTIKIMLENGIRIQENNPGGTAP